MVRPGHRVVRRRSRLARQREDGGDARSGVAREPSPGGKRTSLYSIQWLARRHPDWYRDDLATLFAMLADGKLAPHIASVVTLDEVPAALANLAGHGPPGKQVIAVAQTE